MISKTIYSLFKPFKMKSNTYIPQRYQSAANVLKNACLHYVTKTGCKCSTLYKTVLQCNIVQVCKFAIQPKRYIGLKATERLRVKAARTTGVHVGRTIQG